MAVSTLAAAGLFAAGSAVKYGLEHPALFRTAAKAVTAAFSLDDFRKAEPVENEGYFARKASPNAMLAAMQSQKQSADVDMSPFADMIMMGK